MLDRRKNKIIVVAVTVCVSLFCTKSMSAQQIGIKTNILYDASATINMGGGRICSCAQMDTGHIRELERLEFQGQHEMEALPHSAGSPLLAL